MSEFIDVEVIRHPVGADGTMRHRFTFNVALTPSGMQGPATDIGRQFTAAVLAAFEDEAKRLRGEKGKLRVAFGTSRADGMPLPDVMRYEEWRTRKLQSQGTWNNTSPDDYALWCAGRMRDARQGRVFEWAKAAFTEVQVTSLPQRGLRLFEEVVKAFQACDGDREQAHKLVDYVFSRPKGEIGQELGGVGVCLLALAAAAGLSADAEERREFERVLSRPPEHWAARNKAKNDAGFLAASLETPTVDVESRKSALAAPDLMAHRAVPLRQHDGSYIRDGRSDDELRTAIKADLAVPGAGFVPWPDGQPRRYNGSGHPCDMWTGPCCCGATHRDGA